MWDEWITVNSVQIPNDVDPLLHAWRYVAPGLSDIQQAAPIRNENTVISHAPGRYPNNKIVDEMVCQIPLQIRGAYDLDGEPHADPRQGLIDNFTYLKGALGIATPAAPGEMVGVLWHQPGGAEFVASAFVELVGYVKQTDRLALTVLRLTVTSGEFVEWPGS